MRPLRYSINVTLDGYAGHEVVPGLADDEVKRVHLEALHHHHAANVGRADVLLYGRVTYEMMEAAWRRPADGAWPAWMEDWMLPFAETLDAAEKYVVSSTLDQVDWNAQVVSGDLEAFVRDLKEQPGEGIATGGLTLPLALAELGLIDEYELVVAPVIAGHGPRLFDGLPQQLDLELIDRTELASGAVALRYRPRPPWAGAT